MKKSHLLFSIATMASIFVACNSNEVAKTSSDASSRNALDQKFEVVEFRIVEDDKAGAQSDVHAQDEQRATTDDLDWATVDRILKEEVVVEKFEPPTGEMRDAVFRSVEQPPQFPGGDAALVEHFRNHVQYPKEAQENNIQGMLAVNFVVEKDGSVGEVKVVRSLGRALDSEAVRVTRLLPKFIPGRQNDQLVRVWYTIKLQADGNQLIPTF